MKESLVDQRRIENGKVVYYRCKMFDRTSEEFKSVCDEFWGEVSKYERFKRENYLN